MRALQCSPMASERYIPKKATVIWEIILRDFWGDILRPLITPYRRSDANARA